MSGTVEKLRSHLKLAWTGSLALRFAIATSSLIILACTLLSALLVRHDLTVIHRSLIERANTLGELLVRESQLSVLSGNSEALRQLGEMVAEQPDVTYCRFFDDRGRLLAAVGIVPANAPQQPREDLRSPIEIGPALWEFQQPIYLAPLRARGEELAFPGAAALQQVGTRKRIGTVGVGIALEPLFELRRTAYLTTGFFTVVVALLASASALLLARAFTRPLAALASAADNVARGDLSVTVPVQTQDEVASVARSFNAMVSSLAESRATLEDYSRTLEVRSQRLESLNQQLEEASRLRSEFLAQVSHELRTPLHVIIGYAQMMEEGATGELNAEQRDLLNAIERYSRSQLDLVTNVLDFSRLTSGRISFTVERFALWPLLADTLRLQRTAQQSSSLQTAVFVAPDVPEMETDRIKLQEIIRNLVDNAFKFTLAGTVAIHARRSAEPGRVVIEVTDTGPGIAPENLQAVFDEFHQLGAASTRVTHGVGLGLSIVKHLVHALDGVVSVESELGRGSTFRVEIPCRLREDLRYPESV